MYKRAIAADPDNADNVGNYANYLYDRRNDIDAAEAMYRRALKINPNEAHVLTNYAAFLTHQRKSSAAAVFFKRALEAGPNDPLTLANLAQVFLINGDAEGLKIIDRALALLDEEPSPTAEIECIFYLFAHGPDAGRQDALQRIRTLIASGVRSPGWDFSHNVTRAGVDGHPDSDWLDRLSAVITDDAEPETLNTWPAWRTQD